MFPGNQAGGWLLTLTTFQVVPIYMVIFVSRRQVGLRRMAPAKPWLDQGENQRRCLKIWLTSLEKVFVGDGILFFCRVM